MELWAVHPHLAAKNSEGVHDRVAHRKNSLGMHTMRTRKQRAHNKQKYLEKTSGGDMVVFGEQKNTKMP